MPSDAEILAEWDAAHPVYDTPIEKAAGYVASIGQGGGAGFLDEATAGVNSAAGYLGSLFSPTPRPISEIYAEELAKNRSALAQFQQENPVSSTVAQVGGAVISPLNKLKLIGQGANATGKLANIAGNAAVQSGVYGFGEGEGSFKERVANAADEAALGGGAGLVIGGAGKGLKKLAGAEKHAQAAKNKLFGIHQSDIKKSLEKGVRKRGDATARIVKSLNSLVDDGTLKAGEAAENLARVEDGIDELGSKLKSVLSAADEVQEEAIEPTYDLTLQYIKKLSKHKQKDALRLFQDITEDHKNMALISEFDVERVALGAEGATSLGMTGSEALESNIKKFMAKDIKNVIDEELATPFYKNNLGDRYDDVVSLRDEMSKRFDVLPAMVKATAREGASDPLSKVVATLRTSGGFGVTGLLGFGAGGPVGAGVALAAGAALRSTQGQKAMISVLKNFDSLASKYGEDAVLSVVRGAASIDKKQGGTENVEDTKDLKTLSDEEIMAQWDAAKKKDSTSTNIEPVEDINVLSKRGENLIKSHEGIRLQPYDDGTGVQTIGYGHTGEGVKKVKISRSEADELFQKDIANVQDAISELVEVELSQNQYDAVASLIFNIGRGNFAKSTLLKKLNQGDFQGAANEFIKWRKAGGKVLKGLENRRKEEQRLFMA